MSRVAFATHRESPELTDDDRMAADVLRGRGVGVHPVAWDAPDVDWGGFDLVVIRSTWDYHLKAGVYAEWRRRPTSEPATGSDSARSSSVPAGMRSSSSRPYPRAGAGRGEARSTRLAEIRRGS